MMMDENKKDLVSFKELEAMKYMTEEQRALYFDQVLQKMKLEQILIEQEIVNKKKEQSWIRKHSGEILLIGGELGCMTLACIINNNGMMPAWWKSLNIHVAKFLRLR